MDNNIGSSNTISSNSISYSISSHPIDNTYDENYHNSTIPSNVSTWGTQSIGYSISPSTVVSSDVYGNSIGSIWDTSQYVNGYTTTSYVNTLSDKIIDIEKKLNDIMDYLDYKGISMGEEYKDFINSKRMLEKLSKDGD